MSCSSTHFLTYNNYEDINNFEEHRETIKEQKSVYKTQKHITSFVQSFLNLPIASLLVKKLNKEITCILYYKSPFKHFSLYFYLKLFFTI